MISQRKMLLFFRRTGKLIKETFFFYRTSGLSCTKLGERSKYLATPLLFLRPCSDAYQTSAFIKSQILYCKFFNQFQKHKCYFQNQVSAFHSTWLARISSEASMLIVNKHRILRFYIDIVWNKGWQRFFMSYAGLFNLRSKHIHFHLIFFT